MLRSDDPRIRQVEADGWECVATSWGARLELGPADDIDDLIETDFTAAHPGHRRRGLGTAVKAASVLARAHDGATRFGTGGADSNVASLAMNRAVGYQITETWHTYRRVPPRT